jgi:acyl-CoA reductase-like NAD-dependent aldehyde dehydrogenase
VTITASATAIFRSLNPAPEEITAEYPAMTEAQVEAAPASAESPFQVNRASRPPRPGRRAPPGPGAEAG